MFILILFMNWIWIGIFVAGHEGKEEAVGGQMIPGHSSVKPARHTNMNTAASNSNSLRNATIQASRLDNKQIRGYFCQKEILHKVKEDRGKEKRTKSFVKA